jgi:hypothetical protein
LIWEGMLLSVQVWYYLPELPTMVKLKVKRVARSGCRAHFSAFFCDARYYECAAASLSALILQKGDAASHGGSVNLEGRMKKASTCFVYM